MVDESWSSCSHASSPIPGDSQHRPLGSPCGAASIEREDTAILQALMNAGSADGVEFMG
jgi:hypothetical protein